MPTFANTSMLIAHMTLLRIAILKYTYISTDSDMSKSNVQFKTSLVCYHTIFNILV